MPIKYSSEKRSEAIQLRSKGKSLRSIARELEISLSTAQLWTKEVILSDSQKQKIFADHQRKFHIGQKNFIDKRRALKTEKESKIFTQAKKEVSLKWKDSFFIFGLALYWAEGFKKDHSFGFVNSDPIMIKLFFEWLKRYGNVNVEDVRLRVQIHGIYENRIDQIQDYWARQLEIPLTQFQKPFFQTSKSSPPVVDQSYMGLLRIRAIKKRDFFIQLLGWLEGIKGLKI